MKGQTLLPLCRLYENVSQKTGTRYFVGNLSFTSKLLIFRNEDAKDGEPQWTVYIAEREQKPREENGRQPVASPFDDDTIPDPGWPVKGKKRSAR